ncbi:malonyl-[acyl-carrier protein] O-methyltransferase BioC [Prosthecochloris sp. GSB1]|uniref:malonyl-ACP O-methyltransferase BioC n=1 Tax=Prosthecochloris sp. GSB1 TaxID=281093 RepID=UPI000B8D179F|nr:malonyl-ACP O-methyltransferase BioC [Prosthecochloris sp. GSB1]ASQ91440.1 malonyl-[acyl-carrier protein] O-methyltransferase BioC [Prosthecochloris sp. GSB1]
MRQVNKGFVRQRFGKRLQGYHRHAFIQREMAERLAEMTAAHLPEGRAERLLEVGAGSGALTGALLSRVRAGAFYANDLVPECREMVENAAALCNVPLAGFLAGDIERCDCLPERLDLVASGATVQWLDDLPGFLRRMAGVLLPGGLLAFSTFGPDNMREIRSIESVGLHYHSLAALREMAREHFDVLDACEDRRRLDFTGPEAVLRHISGTGVNGLDRRAWTKSRHRSFVERYRRCFPAGEGVRLTYHTMCVVMRKR